MSNCVSLTHTKQVKMPLGIVYISVSLAWQVSSQSYIAQSEWCAVKRPILTVRIPGMSNQPQALICALLSIFVNDGAGMERVKWDLISIFFLSQIEIFIACFWTTAADK